MALCSFCAIGATADGLFVSAGNEVLPTEAGDSLLIGWTYEKDGETIILAPGASFTAEADMTLDPLYLDMKMIEGASVRTATPAGLRFTTEISEPEYQSLVAMGAKFELGTIIAPTDFIDGEFTYEALNAAGKDCLLIPCKIFWSNSDSVRTYTGVISNLHEENYNRNFSARSYVTMTYTDGSTKTFYSDYIEASHSRSAYRVSCSAMADSSSTLSENAKKVLTEYFNTVGVSVSYVSPEVGNTPLDATNNIPGAHYTIKTEWMCQFHDMTETFVNDRGYQITITIEPKAGVAITEDTNLLLNGKPMKAGSYILKDGVLTIIRRKPLGDYSWAY